MVVRILNRALPLFFVLCAYLIYVPYAQTSYAQANSPISIEVKPTSGTRDEQFLLSIIVSGDAPDAAPNLIASNDFSSSYLGPQSSVMIVNGHISRTIAYVYAITPLREGTLTSPSAELTVGATTWKAAPQVVRIGPAAAAPKGSDQISMSQKLSDRSVYRGQQVVVETEISSSERMYNPQLSDQAVDGAWIEALGKPMQTQRFIRNSPTDIITVRSSLYPLRTGTLSIPGRELQAQIRQGNGRSVRAPSPFSGFDPFGDGFLDDFFGSGRLTQVVVRSNELKLEVVDLPPAPNGKAPIAVGETRVTTTVDRENLSTGETAKLTVQISSTGNLNPLKTIDIGVPNGVKIYPQRPQSNASEHNGLLWSRKVFEYSIVPLKPGDITITVPSLTYFDPESKAYKTTSEQTISLRVSGKEIDAGPATEPFEQQSSDSQVLPTPTPPKAEPEATATPTPIVFEEPTSLERLSQNIAWQSVLLILAILVGSGFLALLLFRRKSALKPYHRYREAIDSATNAHELMIALSKFVQSSEASETLDQGIEPLRIAVRRRFENSINKAHDKSELLEIESLLDELDIAIYGDSPLLNEQLVEFKRRMTKLNF